MFNPCYVLQAGGLGVTRNVRCWNVCTLPFRALPDAAPPLRTQTTVTGCGCEAVLRPRVVPGPPVKGAAYSAGSLAALGIVLPLFTLCIGACGGYAVARKSGKIAPDAHRRLEEVGLT